MEFLNRNSGSTALVCADSGTHISYSELHASVSACRAILSGLARPVLVMQFAGTDLGAIVAYLACLAEAVPLALCDPSPTARDRLISAYKPGAAIVSSEVSVPAGYHVTATLPGGSLVLCERSEGKCDVAVHPELALLLSTSGSTGDPKLVRLSKRNLVANAQSIATYLQLTTGEVAIQSLPVYYSYGLSVLNSHLLVGGTVVLTKHSFMRPEFWTALAQHRCTSFAGVPYMYETLHRLRWNPAKYPSLRTLTQAGGHLKSELAGHFHRLCAASSARFFVMYGQTEATARIAYVPPERLSSKLGSIGVPIPGGELWLEAVEGDGALRQLYYRGPNVMLGYATAPADLARGDDQKGVLATGDIADRDDDGYFRITGRLARFTKLFGKRVNLGSVEAEVEQRFHVRAAAVEVSDRLRLFIESCAESEVSAARSHVADWLGVPPMSFDVVSISALPLTASGKKDYKALK